jgi:hypothetical protein
MATYPPPTEIIPQFNSTDFNSALQDGLTIAEADTRYLKYPVSQGSETISGDLGVSGIATLGTATFTNASPEYRIEYPVNSGRIDFFSNTAGGVLTRGCKIDATGVHTNSKFDTIDETAGTLDIGNNTNRSGPINIGTGTGASKNITIGTGSGGTTLIRGATMNMSSGTTGNNNLFTPSTGGSLTILPSDATVSSTALNIATGSAYTGTISIGTGAGSKSITIGGSAGTTSIQGLNVVCSGTNASLRGTNITQMGDTMTSGSINLGRTDATVSSTAINIASGSAYTGVINIGTGSGNTNSVNIGRGSMITVDGDSGGIPTIFFNRPITPSYTPASIASTTLGYTDFPVASSFGTLSNTVSNIAQFSIGVGVWDLKARVRITSIASVAGNFFRLGFTSSAGSLGTLYGDWGQDGISGNVNILLSGTFAVNSITTIYVRGNCVSGGGGACDVCDVIATRIA